MLKMFNDIIDAIFPPRDTELTIRKLSPLTIDTLYRPGMFNGVQYLSSYHDERTKALIKENKYHRHPHATRLLALLLAKWLETHIHEDIILVPLPLGVKRQKERGFNQVSIILNNLPQKSALTINEQILRRYKDTKAQTSLPKVDRLKNVAGAFIMRDTNLVLNSSSTLVIIDDVVTTGATLAAAKDALFPHLPPNTKIICLALAH